MTGPSSWPRQQLRDVLLQTVISRDANGVFHAPLFQRLVDLRLGEGHDATHVREEGSHRMPNGDIFAKALAEDRIILTFHLDFAEIAALSRAGKVRVILFRLHNTQAPHVI
jgi:predicted nuclease of predicted toxin-antitoxin system